MRDEGRSVQWRDSRGRFSQFQKNSQPLEGYSSESEQDLSLKSLCGGGVPSSHPSLGFSVFFLSVTCLMCEIMIFTRDGYRLLCRETAYYRLSGIRPSLLPSLLHLRLSPCAAPLTHTNTQKTVISCDVKANYPKRDHSAIPSRRDIQTPWQQMFGHGGVGCRRWEFAPKLRIERGVLRGRCRPARVALRREWYASTDSTTHAAIVSPQQPVRNAPE